MPYLFQSDRLGFKNWDDPKDAQTISEISQDPEVMQYFPRIPDATETHGFVNRMQKMIATKNYGYFAVEEISSGKMIGFIGLADQNFGADFCPCTDIGWRLAHSAWGKGYATEGAKACLHYGFEKIGLPEIVAIAPKINLPSIHVMEKIGMQHARNFDHPKLLDYPALVECVLYKKSR